MQCVYVIFARRVRALCICVCVDVFSPVCKYACMNVTYVGYVFVFVRLVSMRGCSVSNVCALATLCTLCMFWMRNGLCVCTLCMYTIAVCMLCGVFMYVVYV